MSELDDHIKTLLRWRRESAGYWLDAEYKLMFRTEGESSSVSQELTDTVVAWDKALTHVPNYHLCLSEGPLEEKDQADFKKHMEAIRTCPPFATAADIKSTVQDPTYIPPVSEETALNFAARRESARKFHAKALTCQSEHTKENFISALETLDSFEELDKKLEEGFQISKGGEAGRLSLAQSALTLITIDRPQTWDRLREQGLLLRGNDPEGYKKFTAAAQSVYFWGKRNLGAGDGGEAEIEHELGGEEWTQL